MIPGDPVELAGGPPAVLVDRPVTDDLEVLDGVTLRCVRVLEAVEEARPFHRLLRGPVHDLGLRDTGRFEDRRPDVDAVRELGAQPTGVLDPFRPGDHHAVARAAEVGGNLLAPLEGRVPRPRPGGRVVRRVRVGAPRVEPAVVLDQRELLLGGECDPVLHRQLVERAGDRALQARAVVAEDVDHERVLELPHLRRLRRAGGRCSSRRSPGSRRRPPSAARTASSRSPRASPRLGARPVSASAPRRPG